MTQGNNSYGEHPSGSNFDGALPQGSHPAGSHPEGTVVCPLCSMLTSWQGVRPELTEHLFGVAGEVIEAVRVALDAAALAIEAQRHAASVSQRTSSNPSTRGKHKAAAPTEQPRSDEQVPPVAGKPRAASEQRRAASARVRRINLA